MQSFCLSCFCEHVFFSSSRTWQLLFVDQSPPHQNSFHILKCPRKLRITGWYDIFAFPIGLWYNCLHFGCFWMFFNVSCTWIRSYGICICPSGWVQNNELHHRSGARFQYLTTTFLGLLACHWASLGHSVKPVCWGVERNRWSGENHRNPKKEDGFRKQGSLNYPTWGDQTIQIIR